jgi:hypothetical protein
MALRNSNWRSRMGIITGWPHLVQGTDSSGPKLLEINTRAPQPPQVTIRSCSFVPSATSGIVAGVIPPTSGERGGPSTSGGKKILFDKQAIMNVITASVGYETKTRP